MERLEDNEEVNTEESVEGGKRNTLVNYCETWYYTFTEGLQ